MTTPQATARSLLLFSLFYGGMVTLAGVLGAKQVTLGPLVVEAGIFPFLTLVGISSGIADLHGKEVADRLVRYGFIPLVGAILMTLFVLQLPTDPGMYEPAKEAFPTILGQSWRMMGAGIISYGTSVTLNVWIFNRLRDSGGPFAKLRGFIAAALSQIVDTLIFITLSFYMVRPIMDLMVGQMIAKVVLSAIMVPAIIWIVVHYGRKLDSEA
ncbi:MAG: queuosine precursor transporter [Novosphingobium sp.]